MDFRQLRYFAHIVELGSFGKAAAILRIAQPALSHQVRNLEEELGVQLLIRHTSGVVPTQAGATLHEHARAILQQVEQARQATIDQADRVSGTVTVGLTPSLCSTFGAPLVKRLRAEHAGINVVLKESLSISLQEWLLGGQIDLAMLHNPQSTKLIVFDPVLEEDLLLVGPAGDAKLPKVLKTAADLADYPLVLPSQPNTITALAQDVVNKAGRTLNIAFYINTLSTITDLVASELAYTVLPYLATHKEMQAGRLRTCVIPDPSLRRTLVIAWSNQRPVTRAMLQTKKALEELIQAFDRETGWSQSRIEAAARRSA
ncbi:MAG: LysR substrate-binding domain-containing protein [Alphaproteobacteria bacterium]|nr:LysR substrate-binding domain-containing protein [Alphaproteobacteria bacterium]